MTPTTKEPAGGNGGLGHKPEAMGNAQVSYTRKTGPVNCLQSALSYAARGWAVLPIRPRGKEPLTAHGVKDATTDTAVIQAWWRRFPDANVGIATGSPSGLLVIDIDPRNWGDESLRDLEQRYGSIPETIEALTGGGGRHIFFRWIEGVRCGKLADGIDIKGDGGYIVAPPSIHPSGGQYVWEALSAPDITPLAAAPAWLLAILDKQAHRSSGNGNNPGGRIPEGQRNVTLTSLAGSMRRKGMTQAAIEAALLAENSSRCDPPLDVEEVRTIAASVSRYEPDAYGTQTHTEGSAVKAYDPGGSHQKDYGHAEVLSRLFKDRYRWAAHRGCWMRYDGKVWQQAVEEQVAKEASDALRQHYVEQLAVAGSKEAVMELSKRVAETCLFTSIKRALSFLKGWEGILTLAEEWDADNWLLNINNGTLDLRTGELRPHHPADLCTKLAPVDYDPDAEGVRWEDHVNKFLPNPNVRRQVQRDLGRALVGVTLEESLPLWYGMGANGKTTTARVLLKLLGDYADRAAPNLLIESNYDRHPTELADLAGRRLVFSIEVDQGKHLAEALVKELTGGDRKKGRFMHQDFFSFEQTFSIVLIVNHKPIVTGTDAGIWRRIRLTPWEYSIPENQRRPQEEVVAELLAEGSAILNWLLLGLGDWQSEHNWVAPEVRAASESYRAEMDVLGDFLSDRCILGPRYEVPKGELYEAYLTWCESNRERPLSQKAFGSMLQDRGIGDRKGTYGKRIYVGIGLLARQPTGGDATSSPKT